MWDRPRDMWANTCQRRGGADPYRYWGYIGEYVRHFLWVLICKRTTASSEQSLINSMDLMIWWHLAQHKWPRRVPKLKRYGLALYHPASLQIQIQIHIMSLHIVFPPAPLLQWWPIPGAGSPPNISAAVKHQIGTIWPENRKQDQEISSPESLMPETFWKMSPI